MWAAAWQGHALTSPARWLDANIFHPTPLALAYGPMRIGFLPFFLPTFLPTSNPLLAHNVAFLLVVSLSAWTMHITLRWWTGSDLAGFLAAWTLLTTRWVLWGFAATNPHYAALPYFPLIVLAVATPCGWLARAAPLALLLVLQGLTDLYLAVALFVPLGGLAAIRLLRSSSRPAAVRLILVLAVAVTLVAVAHGGHLLVRLANPELAMQSPWQSHRIPAEQGALWDLLGLRYFMYDGPDEVPLASLLLIAAGGASFLWRPRIADGTLRQAWRHGVFWVLAGLLLGLPPRLPVGGELVDLPTAWLPFHQVARNTFRLRTATLMGLSILTGLGAAELMRRLTADRVGTSTRWLAAVAMTAIAAAAMYGDLTTRWGRPGALCTPAAVCRPLPASYPLAKPPRLPSPAMLEMLRRPGGALLELPIGTGNGRPWVHAHAMYRSIFHWKPLANGYASYWPADFTARMSTAKALPAAEAVQRLRREIGLDMILLSHDRLSDTERRIWATPAVLRAAGLRVLSRDDSFTLLAVRLGD